MNRLVDYVVFLSYFSFRLQSLEVTQYAVSAVLLQDFVNDQKVVALENLLIINKIFDLATLLKLCTVPPLKNAV